MNETFWVKPLLKDVTLFMSFSIYGHKRFIFSNCITRRYYTLIMKLPIYSVLIVLENHAKVAGLFRLLRELMKQLKLQAHFSPHLLINIAPALRLKSNVRPKFRNYGRLRIRPFGRAL